MREKTLIAPLGVCGVVILSAMTAEGLLQLAIHLLRAWRLVDYGPNLEKGLYYIGAITAAAVAFFLCAAVARDYRPASFLRYAWALFSGDALMAFVRFATEFISGGAAVGIRNMVVSIGLLCLLGGIFAMWWGLYRLRAVFRIGRADIVVILFVGVFALTTLALTMHLEGVTLRLIPVSMIFAGAIGSFLLLRFSGQMQGGQISAVIRVLVVYLAVRCVLNFLVAIAWHRQGTSGLFFRLLQTAMPWILTLAAGLRYDMILSAARKTREYCATNGRHAASF